VEIESPKEPDRRALDGALADRVRKRVLEQPEYYVRTFLSDADARRARDLLGSGRATEDDLAFLRDRIDRDVAEKIEKEKDFLTAAVAAREPDPRRIDAPDVLRFKDRQLEVRVLEESETTVKYAYRGQTVTQSRTDILSVSRGAAPATQFHEKLKAAANPRDLYALAEWCRESRLEPQREYVLYRILLADPANAIARRDLGLPLTGPLKPGPSVEPVPERMGDSYVYEGKAYTAAALRRALAEKGYVVVDGRWCATREWKWTPREYWKSKALKIGGQNITLQTREDVRTVQMYDLDQQKLVPAKQIIPGVHFIGPVAGAEPRAKGTARIEIEPPGPMVECRILAAASVQEGRGSITVQIEPEGRAAVPLYAIASGIHRKAIDAGEMLRGARRFALVAEIETEVAAVDGRIQTFALFLPGDAKDPEPLSIEARVAEPAPHLDKIIPAR
jgi:hypothetical protein